MALIEWDESFSVGFDEIDEQHKRWIQMINDLDDVLINGNPDKLTQIKTASLDAMIAYARTHFSFEEGLLAKINYPEIDRHKEVHNRLTAKLVQIQEEVKSGFTPLNTQIMKIMMNWLQEHILQVDRRAFNLDA